MHAYEVCMSFGMKWNCDLTIKSPRLCREYKMSTLLHNFDFSPTPWGKLHCYNPHHYSPIVYLEDVHKVVFIAIIIISYW